MAAGYQIEHQCPQCGAPIVLEETDRLIRCPYCRVSSYLTAPRMFRYVLPHRVIDRDLVYFPYYRFRGTLFMCAKRGVDFRLIDASIPAQASSYFPPSVGVRAQTQKLRFAVSGIPGKFLPMTLASGVVPETVYKRFGPANPHGILHQEFVGETMSVIYAPFYIYGKLFDGITERAVSRMLPETFEDELEGSESSSWDAHFLATVCPGCGWDLDGERDSLVLMCRNCNTAWQSGADTLESVPVAHVPARNRPSGNLAGTRTSTDAKTTAGASTPSSTGFSTGANTPSSTGFSTGASATMYLPFWEITADIQGVELKNDRDLVRLANLAKVLPADTPSRPIRFWAPAFKVRPKLFLRLARTLTLTQVYAATKEGLPSGRTYPVTLRAVEGVDTIKIMMASFLKPVDRLPELLPGVRVRSLKSQLMYMPFSEGHHEWKNPELHLTIPKAVLRHASNL